MKKAYISLLHKKNKGEGGVAALMVFCIALLMFMCLMVIVLAGFSNINNKWKIKQCAREYLLIAESQGCLTETDIQSMVTELNSYGLIGVNTDGTTVVQMPYGEKVYVKFTGTFTNNASAIGQPGGMLKTTTFDEVLTISRQSTSKY